MLQRMLLGVMFCVLVPATFAQIRPAGIRVREDVIRALREKRVDPAYPQAALKASVHGLVELQVKISQTGEVQNVQLVSGDPVLASSAIEAVKQWHYKAYLLNGAAMTVFTKVTLNYELSSGEGVVLGDPVRTAPAN
jgi:periplasmic protein TonB